MPADASWVVPLASLDESAGSRAGGKAARLGDAARAGLRVPEGFCITAEALDGVLASLCPLDPRRVARAVAAAPLPPPLARDIVEAWQTLGSRGVAVRSSAVDEDGLEQSFAGLHVTTLDVTREEELLEAVRRCWASYWSDAAVAYRVAVGRTSSIRGGVIVQRMVRPFASGVLFTADPLSGDRRSMTIEAVRGPGDALVDGRATPERIVVEHGTGAVRYPTPASPDARLALQGVALAPLSGGAVAVAEEPRVLDDAVIAELTRIGRLLDDRWGHPQDVEWAVDAGGVHVLQVRPITTLAASGAQASGPVVSLPDQMVWTREKIQERFPDPLKPLDASFVEECVFAPGFSDLLRALGLRASVGNGIVRLFGGYAYVNKRTLLDTLRPLPAAVREQLFEGGGAPGPRTGTAAAMLPFALRLLRLLCTRHRAFERAVPSFEEACRRLRDREFADLSRADLCSELDRATAVIARMARGHMHSIVLAEVSYGALLGLLQRWKVPEAAAYAASLSRGLRANRTVEMGERFQQLADALLRCPTALEIVRERAPEAALAALRTLPPAASFLADFDRFVAEFGHRAAKYPLSHPRWRDDPAQVVRMLATQIERGARVDLEAEAHSRAVSLARLHDILRTRRCERLLPVRRALLAVVLRAARTYCGILRENEGFYITKPFPDVKRLLAVIGSRLVGRNGLTRPEEVYFLTLDEIRDLLGGRSPGALRALVAARQDELEAAAPAACPSSASGEILRGVPVSPGLATGRAVVLDDPVEPLEPGRILVTKTLNPSWFATVMLARGVVTDFGGQLSHGAVLAREFRIPAVLGVPFATRVIRAGEVVTLDGSEGTVTLASR